MIDIKINLMSHCGPKNGGYFGYWEGHSFRIGRNHRPMTKIARNRRLHCDNKGWRLR